MLSSGAARIQTAECLVLSASNWNLFVSTYCGITGCGNPYLFVLRWRSLLELEATAAASNSVIARDSLQKKLISLNDHDVDGTLELLFMPSVGVWQWR